MNTKAIYRFGATFVSLISSLSFLAGTTPATAVTVLPPGSTVAGKSIVEWTADWGNWGVHQSSPNAFTDTTGENADINQSGPVFFVAGTLGNEDTVNRSFTVPNDRYLLIPLVSVFGSYTLDGPNFVKVVDGLVELIDDLFATIDGTPVSDVSGLKSYWETSSDETPPKPFEYKYAAANNPFQLPKDDSGQAYVNGYFLMIEPLLSGTHTFQFGGGASSLNFSVKVNATITAIPVPEPSSSLGFLALGILGGALILKRKLEPPSTDKTLQTLDTE